MLTFWQGLGAVDPPLDLDLTQYRVPVYLVRAKRNSLSERFRIASEMRTNAALWTGTEPIVHSYIWLIYVDTTCSPLR